MSTTTNLVEVDLGGRRVAVPRDGLYDRYRMDTDLDEIDRVSSLILDEAAKPLATEARLMGGMSAPIVLAGQALATGGLGLRLAEAFPTCAIATYPVVGSAFAAARAAGASLDRDTLCAALADADGEHLPESSYRPSTLGDWGEPGRGVRRGG